MAFQMHTMQRRCAAVATPRRTRLAAPRTVAAAAGAGPEPEASQQQGRRVPKLIDMSGAQENGSKGPAVSRRALVVPPALATAGLATCACCPQAAKAWGYEGLGTAAWGGVCATGGAQSPIDLPLSELATETSIMSGSKGTNKFGDIVFKYRPNEQTLVMNTGHGTMQVIFPPGNMASVGGVDMELLQFHFHTPSEHAMDGMRSPMEVHLVHKVQSTGSLAVVGVMIEGGAAASHPAIQTAFEYAPALWRTRGSRAQVLAGRPINAASLLPEPANGRRPYVHYAGSLTTPPCSEGVDWFVMTEPIQATDEQVLDFMHYVGKGMTYGFNSRPVQPVNRRMLEYELCSNWAKA